VKTLEHLSFDITTLQQGYAGGAFTPADVIAEVYRRIEAMGERPVWITLVPKAQALANAAAAPKGLLYGIPFAVKDNIDVVGLPTTCACPEFAYTPNRSATVVEQLAAAGAIVIGKTNLDQFATGLVGTRSPYGIPASVFNAEYVSGGSSSGSAVSVAGGLVSFALGTDTAGSGRVPAGFNNIVGLKPTKGWISTRGVVPACRTQDTVSIFALTVSDAAHVMQTAAAYDEQDDYARHAPSSFAVAAAPAKLRVGVPSSGLEFFGDAETEAIFHATVSRAADLGAEIVDVDFSIFRDAAQLLYAGPWVAERLAAIRAFAASNGSAIDATVRGIILGAEPLKTVDAFDAFYRLAALTRQAEAQWQMMDVMLLPTTGTTYKITEVLADPVRLNSNLGTYTNFVNLMDLSALAVPAGFRGNGLPVGVTLIGRAFDDGMLANLGDRLHRAMPDAKLGGTATSLADTPVAANSAPADVIHVAVVGAHLSGQPLNSQLTERNACLVRTTRTAPGYSIYALANTAPPKPGLIFDGNGSGRIEVEIWQMSASAFGSFVTLIPSPLGIGTLKLEDGTSVKGFICEPFAISGSHDITAFGGWRNWLARKKT
jgi:allophanate hydrolase